MREGRKMYRVLVGKPEGKDHLKDQGVDGRMGSKWTIGRLVGGVMNFIPLIPTGYNRSVISEFHHILSQN
jgi:hypothetical protein